MTTSSSVKFDQAIILAVTTETNTRLHYRGEQKIILSTSVVQCILSTADSVCNSEPVGGYTQSPCFTDCDLAQILQSVEAMAENSGIDLPAIAVTLGSALYCGAIAWSRQRNPVYYGLGAFYGNRKLYNEATRQFFKNEEYWPAAYDCDWDTLFAGPPFAYTVKDLERIVGEGQIGLYELLPGQAKSVIPDDHPFRTAEADIQVLQAMSPMALIKAGLESVTAFAASEAFDRLLTDDSLAKQFLLTMID